MADRIQRISEQIVDAHFLIFFFLICLINAKVWVRTKTRVKVRDEVTARISIFYSYSP